MSARWLGTGVFALAIVASQSCMFAQEKKSAEVAHKAATDAQQGAQADAGDSPVRRVPDPGVITTNQTISPAGVQSIFESRVWGVAFGRTSNELFVETNSKPGPLVFRMDWQKNQVTERLLHNGSKPGMQGLVFDAASQRPMLSTVGKQGAELVTSWNGASERNPAVLGKNEVAQVAVTHSDGANTAAVALTFDDAVALIDLTNGSVQAKIPTGIAPFGVAFSQSGKDLYVSNWGGRFPRSDDHVSTTGLNPHADKIVVDSRGIAASGTVTHIDIATQKVVANIEVGLHPTSIALDDARHRLYVTNSNSDSISVIDSERNVVVSTIDVQPFGRRVNGITPEALVISPDGDTLYVACAGINAVAIMHLHRGEMKLAGLVPTGWYPDSIALSPDGKYIAVGSLLGVGSGWKGAPAALLGEKAISPSRRFVHSYRGTVNVISVPDASALRRYTLAVTAANRMQVGAEIRKGATAKSKEESPIPIQAGDVSPIKHVIYVIKENRTYDQFFGGLGKGNGDASLQVYGEDVIPNQRRLAREFVVLDNFYATGGNSADGHQWVTQANETDYTYLPGYGGRSYPYGGEDPMAEARAGFIWNAAAEAGKSFIDFGEYAGNGQDADHPKAKPKKDRAELLKEFDAGRHFTGRYSAKAPNESLRPYLVNDFPAWTLDVPDVVRSSIFIDYLHGWEKRDEMPNIVMVQLPSDHTEGTKPGFSTPKACMADNDYAVGMLVDAVSHSKFWESTLILVVEDDAQNGLDHVDGHRTVALAISPYVKRGHIDSTFYSQVSMIKTMEMIFGMRNLSLFDLIANDMRASFTAKPNAAPYAAVLPDYSLHAMNPPLKALTGQARDDARASMKMNFRVPDAAPTQRLNEVLWRSERGVGAKYPKVKQALFAPYGTDLDDDDRD